MGSPGNPPAHVYLAVHQRFGRTYGRFWCSLLSGSPSSRISPSLSRWSALSHKWIGECPFAKRCKFINLTTAFLCFKCRVSFTDRFWNSLSRFYNCFLEDGPTNLLSTATGSGPSFWGRLKMKFFIFIWSYMKVYEVLHITLFILPCTTGTVVIINIIIIIYCLFKLGEDCVTSLYLVHKWAVAIIVLLTWPTVVSYGRSSKGVHVQIPRTWECGLHSKRDFPASVKLRILRWGDSVGLFRWSQCSSRGLIRGR